MSGTDHQRARRCTIGEEQGAFFDDPRRYVRYGTLLASPTHSRKPGGSFNSHGFCTMICTSNHRAIEELEDSLDDDLQARVRLYLQTRRPSVVRRLDVCARHGAVCIQGIVPSYYDRQVVIECAKRVAGARQIVDMILVRMGQPGVESQPPCCCEVNS